MPRGGIAPVEIGIGRNLLDEKDRLAEFQQLVELGRRQAVPRAPVEDQVFGNLHANATVCLYNLDPTDLAGKGPSMEQLALNGRRYQRPSRPTVVICADGCDPSYLEAGIAAKALPTIAGFSRDGFHGLADAAMPTFTNPNNI